MMKRKISRRDALVSMAGIGVATVCHAPAIAQGLKTVKIAETPGLPAAYTLFGISKGFFKEEGLDVNVVTLPGGAPMVTAALSGDVQFTGGDIVSFTTFRSRRVPVVIVRPGSASSSNTEADYLSMIVKPGSSIKTPADLQGKTLAVNELNNVGAILTLAALKKRGIDISTIKWAEIPLPNVMGALESNQIDAGYAIEPFQTIALSKGFGSIIRQAAEYGPNTQVGLVLTTEQFLAKDPAAVAAFQRGHKKTGQYINAHVGEYREALITINKLTPEVAKAVQLPAYLPQVNRDTLTSIGKTMVEFRVIQQAPDTAGFYAPDA